MRLNTKKKKAAFLTQKNATGNTALTVEPLTDLEMRVSAIFGKFGNGLPVIPEVGIKPFSMKDFDNG